ncbi:glycoside hydrolase family 2 protein [Actinotalea sp. K2]|uniref:glycoside hydrolase family 2 protein n=1 Tax=Actinotalea sp. K2 TaxID=2939438 RepID=UPI002017894F|nr:glycoside hydrolase family 2 TIM barrel-domain containing protein [Actinotalea sp. K2]MCL3862135.1 glycoside hydrolase family 2 [Actinotalea sp. K2]
MITASTQDGSYPRPQLVRTAHQALDRECGFAYDDSDVGLQQRWHERADVFDRRIRLPFSPESAASGIGETGYHPVVWYRIEIGADDLAAAGLGAQGDDVLVHFGAVDHVADVWFDGMHVGRHEGGQTSFTLPVTHALDPHSDNHTIVVRAQDDPLDLTVPRGKQDWLPEPHAIWYHRITGIWRTVWLEAVPAVHITDLAWRPDIIAGTVGVDVALSARPARPTEVRIDMTHDGQAVATHRVTIDSNRVSAVVTIPALANGQGYGQLLWSPDRPTLLDAQVVLVESGTVVDTTASYLGLRSVQLDHGRFLLNDRPVVLRSVLEQGYWPTSHYTAPDHAALREEAELILSLGFNATRIHQKVEDPRFLYWCDRLGLMVWGETAGAYEFSPLAVQRLTREWVDIVLRDRSHPCIVTWVPVNESWGVQQIAHDPAQQAFATALARLTRAIDPSRPVLSNDGWEHTDSDMWTFHDYEASGDVLRLRYSDERRLEEMLAGVGPAGRRMVVGSVDGSAGDRPPIMVTEFGGISFATGPTVEDAWGYSGAEDADDFTARFEAVVSAVRDSPLLSGFCYTQLTDTRQEINGICDENRKPKIPAEDVAAIVRGTRKV